LIPENKGEITAKYDQMGNTSTILNGKITMFLGSQQKKDCYEIAEQPCLEPGD